MISGSVTSDRPMATRWRSPPDSSSGRLLLRSASPRSRSNSVARSSIWALSIPAIVAIIVRFSRAVRNGTRLNDWNTKPTERARKRVRCRLLRLVTTVSPMLTSPSVGVSRPPIIDKRVVLPDPDGPTSATNSFSASLNSALLTAVTAVRPSPYTLVRLATSSAVVILHLRLL